LFSIFAPQLELDLMEERLGEIERVVISLSAGKLSKDILPPKQLGNYDFFDPIKKLLLLSWL